MEEGDLPSALENLRAVLALYRSGAPPRDVMVETEEGAVSFGDLVGRMLGRPAQREDERRARQRTGRYDGDDNPGWQGSGMHWTPSLCHLESGMRSHP